MNGHRFWDVGHFSCKNEGCCARRDAPSAAEECPVRADSTTIVTSLISGAVMMGGGTSLDEAWLKKIYTGEAASIEMYRIKPGRTSEATRNPLQEGVRNAQDDTNRED